MLPCLESTVFDVLEKPSNAIAIELSRVLARLRPGKHVAAVECDLDVEGFARAGRCTLTLLPNTPSYARVYPDERYAGVRSAHLQAWRRVEWQGHALEVVTVTFGDGGCAANTCEWVIAANEALVHQFLLAVWSCDDAPGTLVFQHGRFQRSELMHACVSGGSFDDLVLAGGLACEIRSDVQRFFARRAFYEAHRLPWKRGLLFVGPPGNGKTQTVRALLSELRMPVLYVKGFRARNDDAENNIRRVFERARRQSPGVLVLEDLDCLIEDHYRSVFLNELDGFTENSGLLVIATTNHPEKLDRSILDRPSRFDRKFHFPLPAEPERRAYLARWSAAQVDAMRLSEAAVSDLARRTKGFTFAYLKELMLSAALRFADGGREIDALALDVLKELTEQMASTAVVLGPIERRASIGFAEASK
ncbi:MAG: ATP-binding protein [Myxococcaceae bacterium]|nr:ATP-binding protein [Myxococcaceae bacterium]